MGKQTLSKSDRLCSEKLIGGLFASGNSRFRYPLRLIFREVDSTYITSQAQVAFSVPKKRFKRANKRNTIKRRMREAYRLQKSDFYGRLEAVNSKVIFMFVYASNDILSFQEISKSISELLVEMVRALENEKTSRKNSDTAN